MSFKRRVYPAAISVIFLLFLLLPFCLFMVGPRKEISEAEKRKLAVFPEIVPTMTGLAEFPKKFDAFYRDHFGLRDNLIRLYNIISLKVFQVSPSDFVLKGREGLDVVIARYYSSTDAESYCEKFEVTAEDPSNDPYDPHVIRDDPVYDAFGYGWRLSIPQLESRNDGRHLILEDGQDIKIDFL